MKILFICGKKKYFLEKEEKSLVLAGVVGSHFLGIFFHRDESSSERSSPIYPFNPPVWNRRASSLRFSAPKR
jgi:hypothetical protein